MSQNVSVQGLEGFSEELRLTRTILERLECSFARQEAKLDRLLDRMTAAPPTAPTTVPQTPQLQPLSVPSSTSSFEYLPSAVIPRPYDMEEFDAVSPRSALPQAERLMDNPNITGKIIKLVYYM